MGETTGITYARHTFSPWWSCTKFGPGCLNCYAEKVARRREIAWGKGQPRVPVSESTWKHPERWARKAVAEGERRRVLVSMCDYLDAEAPADLLARFLDLVARTADGLDWMLLTKRADRLPLVHAGVSSRAWMGLSICNQEEAKRDAHKLVMVPAALRFISYEPALGPLDLTPLRYHLAPPGHQGINLVIAGCESGADARPAEDDWFRAVRDACEESGAVFYLKQMRVGGRVVKLPELDGRQHMEMPK